MGNRLIKESICTSESIDRLTPFEETFFYRLLVNCDDYGLMDARVQILKCKLFPLRVDAIENEEIEAALDTLASCGLVTRYRVDGKPYLRVKTWSKHQTIRNKHSKYPLPHEGDTPGKSEQTAASNCESSRTDEASAWKANADETSRVHAQNHCEQPASNCMQIESNCAFNPIQSNPKESNPNSSCCYYSRAREDKSDSLMTEEEATAQQHRIDDLLESAKRAGFPGDPVTMDKLVDMACDYSFEWTLRAIDAANSGGVKTINYLRGILKNYRQNGGPDAPKSREPPSKPKHGTAIPVKEDYDGGDL